MRSWTLGRRFWNDEYMIVVSLNIPRVVCDTTSLLAFSLPFAWLICLNRWTEMNFDPQNEVNK
jgi:hypothetical protein